MKRYQFGINIDAGVPLTSKFEFEKLYIDCFADTYDELLNWMNYGVQPILLGGQIGSGKTTVINKAINESDQKPDIVLHFDQETLNLDAGDYWSITLSGFIETALKQKMDLTFSNLPQELIGSEAKGWEALLAELNPKIPTMTSFETKVSLRKKIGAKAEYMMQVIKEIGSRLQEVIGRPLFLLASGLDKFPPRSSALFSIKPIIRALANYKTLFEVNAVYLFLKDPILNAIDPLFLPAIERDRIAEMLSKRMGVYATPISKEIEILAQWSGGNPRQAIRLLHYYQVARRDREKTSADSIMMAIQRTRSDFFAYSPKPLEELIKSVNRDGGIEHSLLTLPGDHDTAQRALYGNWILLRKMGEGQFWPATINPLAKGFFASFSLPEEPETKILEEYAKKTGISSFGLSFNQLDKVTGEEKEGTQILAEFLATGVEHPIPTNLSEVFEILYGALLSKDRTERAIIAYKEPEIVDVARAYLFAKANTYEFQPLEHYSLEGGVDKVPMAMIEEILNDNDGIISLAFSGEWSQEQLEVLDKYRDRLLDCQMLWWIPYENLSDYLQHWTQLRQLFEIFILEDELLASISREEVEADLAIFGELTENEAGVDNVIRNLRTVLDYLSRVQKGENHG